MEYESLSHLLILIKNSFPTVDYHNPQRLR